ncbi:uncharacterized protein P884DRAFT_52533 [Thermothelomyces heterothallicus CBS 202.75]|uniref:uncharacterized protein n=1 Tax=Thermothelomyces heterothallicus CBS 202.75 TaxID=1149848 RepID=UPI0037440AD0
MSACYVWNTRSLRVKAATTCNVLDVTTCLLSLMARMILRWIIGTKQGVESYLARAITTFVLFETTTCLGRIGAWLPIPDYSQQRCEKEKRDYHYHDETPA